MENQVRISVIMPSLNVNEYIDACMASVRNQTLCDIEILCIDAGSTDGTVEKLAEYAQKDARIKLLHSDIRSYGHQVNMGLGSAVGEYIAIVETDDYVSTNMLDRLYDVAKRGTVDYVKGNFASYVDYYGHRRFYPDVLIEDVDVNYEKVFCPRDRVRLPVRDYSIWRGIYRTEFLRENRICCSETPGASYQDIGFVLQVYDKAKQCAYVEDIVYYYQCDREGSSSCKNEVLCFVQEEFRRLFDQKLIEQNKAIYMRLVNCLLPELNKLLPKLQFELDEEFVLKPYRWIGDQIRQAMDCGVIGEDDFDAEMWGNLQLALEDIEKYAEYQSEKYHELMLEKQERLAPFCGKTLIIFGSGVYGRRHLIELEELGAHIYCVCDNSLTKVGTILEGYEVISPEQAHKEYPEAVFVIPDRPYKTEMMNQLKAIGAEYVVMTV